MTLLPASNSLDTSGKHSGMPLHAFLTRMIWLCVLPPVLLAAYLAIYRVQTLQAGRDLEAANLAKNFATAIDQRLSARIGALHMLAGSPLTDDASNWKALYQEAQGFQQSFGGHVILADPGMRMLFNTRVPFGTPLPALPRPKGNAAAPAALETGKPAVGDTFFGPIAGEPLVAIAVPAQREGKTAFLLLATFETRQFQQRLDQVVLPVGWSLALLDGKGEVIARRTPPGLNPASDVDTAGRFVVKSAVSPWSVALEIPRDTYRAPLFAAAAALAITILGATLLGILGGHLASRRLGRAVASLADTPASGNPPPEIIEIAMVRRMLGEAAQKRGAAEAARRESEAHFRATLEMAAVGIADVAPDGRWLYVNQKLCSILGYSSEELLQQTFQDITYPEDLHTDLAYVQQMLSGELKTYSMEKRYVHKDGHLVWANLTVALVRNEAGLPDYFISVVEDIERRKRAEQELQEKEAQYRGVIETSSDGFWMADQQGRLLEVNASYVHRSGYSREELLAMRITDLDADESPAETVSRIERLKRDGHDHFNSHHRAKDGSLWPVEVVASYLPVADGKCFGFIRDLTDRKQAELERHELRAEMEQLLQLHVARQTASALAHDLNQPLVAISAYSEAALRMLHAGNPRPEKLLHALQASAKESQRAGAVVRQLLDSLHKAQPTRESLNLNKLVKDALLIAEEEGLHIPHVTLDLAQDLPPVAANSLQLQKAITNLLRNSGEAMQGMAEDAAITIRTSLTEGVARVTIQDSGPGLSEEMAEHLFEPFFTTKPTGIGMGLAISRTLIEANGGRLWHEYTANGAIFHFILPLVQ